MMRCSTAFPGIGCISLLLSSTQGMEPVGRNCSGKVDNASSQLFSFIASPLLMTLLAQPLWEGL